MSKPLSVWRIELGAWPQLRERALPIRWTVFVAEQGVPAELELDAWDERSVHALASDDKGQSLGTGRLRPDGHIGRMAVLPAARGQGLGRALLTALMAEAQRRGHLQIRLSAQVTAVGFYKRAGFVATGQLYQDAGIAHQDMVCKLS